MAILQRNRALNRMMVDSVTGEQTQPPLGRGAAYCVIEPKKAADKQVTIWTVFQQLPTHQAEIPSPSATKQVLVVSDGIEAHIGPLGAGREWLKPWRTMYGDTLALETMLQLRGG
ncbi:MAG: hypothetical protein NZ578_07875 [Candidatus Binatia bacterium]|nr:hypothetical protein [Candidatus Binatia bacterium]